MKELNIEARIENLDPVLDFINDEIDKIDCPLKTKKQIDIAAEEIFVNIANYAYDSGTGSALIRIIISDHEVWLEFEDSGKPYNPLEKDDPDISASAEDRAIGGLGILMTKKMMDTVEYQYKDSKNLLKVKKNIS
jgi:anti-sigma regulatory factor (Ser/Thr protein kinase)